MFKSFVRSLDDSQLVDLVMEPLRLYWVGFIANSVLAILLPVDSIIYVVAKVFFIFTLICIASLLTIFYDAQEELINRCLDEWIKIL